MSSHLLVVQIIVFAVVGFLCIIFTSFDKKNKFGGSFSGDVSAGKGKFIATIKKDSVRFNGRVTDLSGDITAAHIHKGAVGVNGGPVRTIQFTANGNVDGVWTITDDEPLTPGLLTDLKSGQLYVNVHTALHPDGEVRAQIVKQ
jgi:hypothetical protein